MRRARVLEREREPARERCFVTADVVTGAAPDGSVPARERPCALAAREPRRERCGANGDDDDDDDDGDVNEDDDGDSGDDIDVTCGGATGALPRNRNVAAVGEAPPNDDGAGGATCPCVAEAAAGAPLKETLITSSARRVLRNSTSPTRECARE